MYMLAHLKYKAAIIAGMLISTSAMKSSLKPSPTGLCVPGAPGAFGSDMRRRSQNPPPAAESDSEVEGDVFEGVVPGRCQQGKCNSAVNLSLCESDRKFRCENCLRKEEMGCKNRKTTITNDPVMCQGIKGVRQCYATKVRGYKVMLQDQFGEITCEGQIYPCCFCIDGHFQGDNDEAARECLQAKRIAAAQLVLEATKAATKAAAKARECLNSECGGELIDRQEKFDVHGCGRNVIQTVPISSYCKECKYDFIWMCISPAQSRHLTERTGKDHPFHVSALTSKMCSDPKCNRERSGGSTVFYRIRPEENGVRFRSQIPRPTHYKPRRRRLQERLVKERLRAMRLK